MSEELEPRLVSVWTEGKSTVLTCTKAVEMITPVPNCLITRNTELSALKRKSLVKTIGPNTAKILISP